MQPQLCSLLYGLREQEIQRRTFHRRGHGTDQCNLVLEQCDKMKAMHKAKRATNTQNTQKFQCNDSDSAPSFKCYKCNDEVNLIMETLAKNLNVSLPMTSKLKMMLMECTHNDNIGGNNETHYFSNCCSETDVEKKDVCCAMMVTTAKTIMMLNMMWNFSDGI